jgi:Uma2 family endonuclease
MSAVQEHAWISPESYLLGENDRADGPRYEYVDGQVYAIVGASRAHNLVSMNLAALLHSKLAGSGCAVFQSDMKVRIRTATEERFYYPDIQVTCHNEPETYYNSTPCLIVEVLSSTTERIDRTEKLDAYRLIDSLQEYLLLSQDSPHAEVYRRNNHWKPEYRVGSDSLRLESVDLELSLEEVYRSVFTS